VFLDIDSLMSRFKSLPKTWALTTLGEVYQVIGGGTPSTKVTDYWGGDTPWITSADIEGVRQINIRKCVTEKGIAASTTNKVPPKTLLVVTRVGLGKIAIADTAICFSQDLQGLIQNPKLICPEYTLYLLSYELQFLKFDGRGTTISGVTKKQLTDLAFPLPPINEQRRIVAKIEALFSELDKGIESFKTAREQLKIYRQALLKHAFSGKLTEQWRTENQDAAQGRANAARGQGPVAAKLETAEALLQRIHTEREQRYQQQLKHWEANSKQGSKPKAPKTLPPLTAEELAELPELPEGWIYLRAEDISNFITKGTTPSKEQLFAGSGEVPFIKVYNLTKTGHLDFTIEPAFVSKATHEGFLGRSKVYPNDVLMNIVGPPLGKVSIVPNSYPEWNINQAIVRFRSGIVASNYLCSFLLWEDTLRLMSKKTKTTAGQVNLTLEICRDIKIPICGNEEQNQILSELESRLSIADQLDQTLTTALQQAEALRQAILKKAFSGQLVPQDPNDGPASVLLERIKNSRQDAKAQR
jgi:type I restriction enzyme, S subunit